MKQIRLTANNSSSSRKIHFFPRTEAAALLGRPRREHFANQSTEPYELNPIDREYLFLRQIFLFFSKDRTCCLGWKARMRQFREPIYGAVWTKSDWPRITLPPPEKFIFFSTDRFCCLCWKAQTRAFREPLYGAVWSKSDWPRIYLPPPEKLIFFRGQILLPFLEGWNESISRTILRSRMN